MPFEQIKYAIIMITQISILLPFASRVRGWQLTCPDSSQWTRRARGFCNITKPYYYCLFDANSLHYTEFCRVKEDFHKPGNKYIIRGDIDGEPCEENRYQPFKFQTDGSTDCMFEKSFCNEEGQIVQNNGNTTADNSCRCDYTKGYSFVVEPTHKCLCHPTQEDCSCYKKKCSTKTFINPNYECGTHLIGDFDCTKIKTNRWKDKTTAASAAQNKPTIPLSPFLGLSGFKAYIHPTKLIILIFVLSMLFVFVLFIFCGVRLIDKCSQFIKMDDIISERVKEEMKLNKKDQNVPDDSFVINEEEIRLQTIRDIHTQHINDWIKDDEMFIETIATHKIYERLKKDSCVLIVGSAGNGKSSILRHIALDLRKKEQYEIIPIVLSPSGIFEFLNRKQKQIFIVDDLCGKVIINAQSVDVWFSQINKFVKLISTSGKNKSPNIDDVKFLLATGLDIYNDSIFQRLKLLTEYVCLLSKWPLTDDEKIKMIKKYISPEAESKLRKKLTSDEAYFPLLCKIAERKTTDQIINLFSNLNDFIKQDILVLRETNKFQFCTIALCALFNNNFKEDILNDVYESNIEKQAFEQMCLEFDLEPNKDQVRSKIKEQLGNLEKMYMMKTENCYQFIHSKVYHIAVVVCGQIFLLSFIKFVRSSFIAESFCFQSIMADHNKDTIIICNKDVEKRYFDRLMFDLEQGDTYSTFHNSQLQSESYRNKFCAYCAIRKQKMSELLKRFSEKRDKENVTYAEKSYEDYTEFAKQYHFSSHEMRNPLIESAWEGYADIVQMLLDFGCNINEADEFKRTPLFVACLLGKTEVVEVLLENNADHSLCDEKNQSPLLVASKEGNHTIVEVLLQKNADIYHCDVNGNSPLLVASSGSHLSTVQTLSKRIVDLPKCNNLGQTPVFVASKNGKEDVVRYLLSFLIECISTPDNEGRSPLFIACSEGHYGVAKLLLENNDDVERCDKNKRSPLFIASDQGHEDIVKLLIQNDAKINHCDKHGTTPLFAASDKGRTGTAKILVENGADFNASDNEKRTPLYAACKGGFMDIVSHLIENGSSVLNVDLNGNTPLLVAIKNKHTEIAKFLINKGAEVNQIDHDKKSPLHLSVVGCHIDVVKLLIDKGALQSITDNENQTPFDLACKYSCADIVKLFHKRPDK